ncbi:MAG: hypothetical protein PHS14_10915, partial [Elusimicrobia bacterium]|nr:hypothetical protein [Elusimicrobiota bacterium]
SARLGHAPAADRRPRRAAGVQRLKPAVDEKGRTAVIPLPGAERLPASVGYRGETFVRKSELHATLVGSRGGYDGAALSAAALGLDFNVRPSGIYRLARFGDERSLIELARIDGQEEYYERLEAALGRRVPRVPAHVTLFTEPGGRGIGLYTADQLEACSFPADLALEESPWRLDGNGAILAP